MLKYKQNDLSGDESSCPQFWHASSETKLEHFVKCFELSLEASFLEEVALLGEGCMGDARGIGKVDNSAPWGPLDPKIWEGGGIGERVRFHNYNNQTNPL